MSATHQTGSKINKPMVIGTANASAVSADNCCGERFFRDSILIQGSWLKVEEVNDLPINRSIKITGYRSKSYSNGKRMKGPPVTML